MSDQTSQGFILRIEGRDYDATDLTLDEVEEIEETIGVSLEEIDIGRAKVLKAIVYTLLKRDDPEVTMETVGKIRMRSLFEEKTDTNGALAVDHQD